MPVYPNKAVEEEASQPNYLRRHPVATRTDTHTHTQIPLLKRIWLETCNMHYIHAAENAFLANYALPEVVH